MALLAADMIERARGRHAVLRRAHTPQTISRELLGAVQRYLIARGSAMDPYFCEQRAQIFFAVSSANTPANVLPGGNDGGLPLTVDANDLDVADAPAGSAAGYEGLALVADREKNLISSTTGGKIPGTFGANEFQGGLAIVHSGPGVGEEREIDSNLTDGTFTIDGTWGATDESIISVFKDIAFLQAGGAVTALPPLGEQRGYLVKLDASGAPYIDYTAPIVARFEAPIRMPSIMMELDGNVYFTDDAPAQPFETVSRGQRHSRRYPLSGHVANGKLYLHGPPDLWQDVRNIELSYVPSPDDPEDTDYLLLDDSAQDAVIDELAARLSERLLGTEIVTPEVVQYLRGLADRTVTQWVDNVIGSGSKVEAIYTADVMP